MHHSKELAFTFMMVLIFSRSTVSVNNYSMLYMVHSIPLTFFHIIELWLYLNLTLSSPASLKLQNKTLLSFYCLLLVMSIQMLEWRQVMSIQYLKLNAESIWHHWNWQLRHFEYIAEFLFSRIFYFCLQICTKYMPNQILAKYLRPILFWLQNISILIGIL